MRFQYFILSAAFIFLFQSKAYSQLWPGYETGRFTGISSATLRPGGMSPMPYKVDATIFAFHVNTEPKQVFGKDIITTIFSGGFHNLTGFSQLTSNRTHVFGNFQGPSVLIQAHEKAAIGFAWNNRNMWLSDFSNPNITRLFDKDSPTLSLSGANESFNVLFMGWSEFAIGGGGELWDDHFHKFSIGGFAKIVTGTGLMSLNAENINVNAQDENLQSMSMALRGEVSQNMSELVDDDMPPLVGKPGFGFDFGAEYRHLNPRSCPGASNYKIKVGFSVTDIGKIRFGTVRQYSETAASTSDNIPLETFRSGNFSSTSDTLEQLFGITPAEITDFSMMLPMSLRLYFEYNIRRRGIIYNELHMIFAQLSNPDMPMVFRYNVTPRFEDDRFGIYVPMTFTNYVPANVGLAIRLKPVIIGSESLFTFWAYDDRGPVMDFFIALKIPILNPDERIDWKRQMSTRLKK